ncbi:MAG TPA: hypothetical protein VKV23_08150 [Acidimicrobiales bacterium]|nr:hypothetical protein [Acidimicrobiales bacterium]
MTRRQLVTFAADVARLGPLVALGFAVAVNVENLAHVLDAQLSVAAALWRFALALALGLGAVRLLTRVLLAYARQAAGREEDGMEAARGPASTPRRAGR